MKLNRLSIAVLLMTFSVSALAEIKDIWPRIPFNIQGANLCEFRAAYSQTRSEYMSEMVFHAETLLMAGDFNPTQTLMTINRMYEQNLAYAKRGLGVTLENTFKAYMEQFYNNLKPRTRNLEFKHVKPIDEVINLALRGHQVRSISISEASKIDLFLHGTYSMSPNCNGNIVVTLSSISRDGTSKTYTATGRPSLVMSKIASRIFEDYQRTKFPSTIKIGRTNLTLLGGLNGDIDKTFYLEEAQGLCEILGGRLPTSKEYKIINSYGSWSGGITLGRKIWALRYPDVFVPYFTRAPQRSYHQVNEREYYYICVK